MKILEKYRLSKVSRMTDESFLKSLRPAGSSDDLYDIVQWFASKWGCTAIQLSALCYYSYVWGLVFLKKEIAPFSFSKTSDGPVDKRISKIFGLSDRMITSGEPPKLNSELERLLSLIWEKYGQFNGRYLMQRAQSHYPYLEAEDTLKPKDMYLFYAWIGLL